MMYVGESCIVLVAKMDLIMGTEMTYNYQYYNDGMDCIARMKRQKCLCDSQRCSGNVPELFTVKKIIVRTSLLS